MERPLISICIPTYNRVDALQRCVDSIVNNKSYDSDIIEIVISDNCSSDGTQAYVQRIEKTFHNISYNRNDDNIGGDMNFIKVLSIAHGEFKKLLNDYSLFTDEGLGFLVNTVKQYKPLRTLLFFSVREKESFSYIECKDMNDFVDAAATDTSWIGSYGFWDEDFDNLDSKDSKRDSKFMQIDWILRLIQKKRNIVVCYGGLLSWGRMNTKHGDYNIVQLFTQSFPYLFLPYVESKDIDPSTYDRLMKRLFVMLLRWCFKVKFDKQKYSYDISGTFKQLKGFFGQFNWYCFYLVFYTIKYSVKHILIIVGLYDVIGKYVKKERF